MIDRPDPSVARDDPLAANEADAPRQALTALLADRTEDATVCPSEIARALADRAGRPDDWRDYMPAVHETVDRMVAERSIRLSWKSAHMPRRSGPYRIRA